MQAHPHFLEALEKERKNSVVYPLENKHGAIVAVGLSSILTGVFFAWGRSCSSYPDLLSDMTWATMYVLHGLAGAGLIALIMANVYFVLRPEKRASTKSMIFG